MVLISLPDKNVFPTSFSPPPPSNSFFPIHSYSPPPSPPPSYHPPPLSQSCIFWMHPEMNFSFWSNDSVTTPDKAASGGGGARGGYRKSSRRVRIFNPRMCHRGLRIFPFGAPPIWNTACQPLPCSSLSQPGGGGGGAERRGEEKHRPCTRGKREREREREETAGFNSLGANQSTTLLAPVRP